jgi:hypothetical protein
MFSPFAHTSIIARTTRYFQPEPCNVPCTLHEKLLNLYANLTSNLIGGYEIMTLYRICTEDKPNLADLVSARFEAFTIFHGVGYWRGVAEKSATIEIVLESEKRSQVLELAETIRRENHQEAVLVQAIELNSVLVEANNG